MLTSNRLLSLTLLCLFVLLAVVSGLTAHAQETNSETEFWYKSQIWPQKYKACFSTLGHPDPARLQALVAEAEHLVDGDTTSQSWKRLPVLYTLAGAYRNLQQWKLAESTEKVIIAICAAKDADVDRPPTETERESLDRYSANANQRLAGIYGAQHRWLLAMRTFLWAIRLFFEQDYLSFIGAALCLLALWALIGWTNPAVRVPRRMWFWLALFTASPLLFMVVSECALLIVSAVMYGNPFLVFARELFYSHVLSLSDTAWVILMIGFSIGFCKSQVWREALQHEKTYRASNKSLSAAKALRPGQRIILFFVVAVLGWILQHIANQGFLLESVRHLPADLTWWRKTGSADGYLVFALVFRLTAGVWVQELFFRGVVYRYARCVFGTGFALIFSSCVFAAWHGEPANFMLLFWYGLVCAVQYEVSDSLAPSTTTHCLNNFLVFISKRP